MRGARSRTCFAMAKEAVLCCLLLACSLQMLLADNREPSVQVYTRHPVEIGEKNTVQCYVDRFHPPKINITLLKNNQPMESQRSDLSFHPDWTFHQLVFTHVIMNAKDEYTCRVEHEALTQPKIVRLEY